MSKLPADIEVLVNDDGVFVEIRSLISFLRNNKNIPDEYKSEVRRLNKIADYLDEQMADLIAQKTMLDEVFDKDKPN